jgi:hypothetical protein
MAAKLDLTVYGKLVARRCTQASAKYGDLDLTKVMEG